MRILDTTGKGYGVRTLNVLVKVLDAYLELYSYNE